MILMNNTKVLPAVLRRENRWTENRYRAGKGNSGQSGMGDICKGNCDGRVTLFDDI